MKSSRLRAAAERNHKRRQRLLVAMLQLAARKAEYDAVRSLFKLADENEFPIR